jgi:ABC-2 type transport system permease protein
MKLVNSEWRKLIYARANWGLLVAATLLASLQTVIAPVIFSSDEAGEGLGLGLSLSDSAAIDSIYSSATQSYFFALILGVLVMAGEFRHGTAVATFLTAPKRESVLVTKLGVAAVAGAILMIIATGLGMLAGFIALQFFDDVASPRDSIFIETLLVALIAGAVLGVIGVGIGQLVRNQMLAIVGSLIYLLVVDPLLLTLWADAGKWLPTGLITSMMNLQLEAPVLGFDTSTFLPPLTATLVLLGYGAVFAVLGVITSMRRDVD